MTPEHELKLIESVVELVKVTKSLNDNLKIVSDFAFDLANRVKKLELEKKYGRIS